MDIDFPLFDNDHLPGESAMRPIAPRLARQAALLRLVGTSPLRCHAVPGTPITAHTGASNCRFQNHFIPLFLADAGAAASGRGGIWLDPGFTTMTCLAPVTSAWGVQ